MRRARLNNVTTNMGKDIDIKQEIESSLAAVQRLRNRREGLLEEIHEIDESLEKLQGQIVEILSATPTAAAYPASPAKLAEKKQAKKDGELTVNAAVLQVILDARKDISKSDIRIGAMKLAGPFSESALNSALMYWVDQKEIKNTSRGFYTAA